MAIGVQYRPDGMTLAQYGAFHERLTEYLAEQGIETPEGALHLCRFGDDGALGGFEIWESEDAFRRFEVLVTALLAELGIEGAEPTIVPIRRLSQAAAEVPWVPPA
jgi:hypothetical protein